MPEFEEIYGHLLAEATNGGADAAQETVETLIGVALAEDDSDPDILQMVAWLGRRLETPSIAVVRKTLRLITTLAVEGGGSFRAAAAAAAIPAAIAAVEPDLEEDARQCTAALGSSRTTMIVTVPNGVETRQLLVVETPNGKEVEVVVPAGVVEGDEFEFELPVELPVELDPIAGSARSTSRPNASEPVCGVDAEADTALLIAEAE